MSLTTQERRAWLERVPLFRGCTSEVIDQLADAGLRLLQQLARSAPVRIFRVQWGSAKWNHQRREQSDG